MNECKHTLVVVRSGNSGFHKLIKHAQKYSYFEHSQILDPETVLLMFEQENAAAFYATTLQIKYSHSADFKSVIGSGAIEIVEHLPKPFVIGGRLLESLRTKLDDIKTGGVFATLDVLKGLDCSSFDTDSNNAREQLIRISQTELTDCVLLGRLDGIFEPETIFAVVNALMGTEHINREAVLKALKRCIRLGLNSPDVWNRIGSFYLMKAQYARKARPKLLLKAEAALEKAIQTIQAASAETRATAYANLALLSFMNRNTNEAVKFATQALEYSPTNHRIRCNLAVLLMALPNPIEARKHLSQIIQQWPMYLRARYYMGILLIRCGEPDLALKHIEYYSSINPGDAYGHYWAAICATKLEQNQKSLKHARRAHRLRKSDGACTYLLAYALAKSGKFKSAHELLHGLMEKDPNHALPYVTGAYFLIWEGDFNGAKRNYELALEKEKDESVFNSLATVYFALGEVENAKRVLEEAMKRWPEEMVLKSNYQSLCRLLNRSQEEQQNAITDLKAQLKRIAGYSALNVEYSNSPVNYEMFLRTGGYSAYATER